MQSDTLARCVALVTGASRGIGRAAAEHFAAQGATVIAVARNAEHLAELSSAIAGKGGTCRAVPLDLCDLKGLERLAATIASEFGKLDLLIGNAARFPGHFRVHEVPLEAMQETLQLNFLSNWWLLRCCHPLLLNSKAGRVVFISSSGIYGGYPEWSAYAASKAALDRVMAAYASENEDTPIRCNSFSPGPVVTEMGLRANKGEVGGMVTADKLMPALDFLVGPDLKHTGEMFDFRHSGGMQPMEVWRVGRF